MILIIKGHSFKFEMENICRLFAPQEKIVVADSTDYEDPGDESIVALTALEEKGKNILLTAGLKQGDGWEYLNEQVSSRLDNNELGRRLALLLYRLFVKLFKFTLPWGAVTGVRPVKLMRKLIEKYGEAAAVNRFGEDLLVDEDKIALCLETLRVENDILSRSQPNSFSLYISIPFCPTRCDYCSFVSHTVERAAKLIPEYVERLCEEIRHTGGIAKQLGLRLETIYIGGGTPTTMTPTQLGKVITTVESSFDMSTLCEFTVEAGRPDTIDRDKLNTIKAAGVTRISINPQTLQEHVLNAIGRRHTVKQFYDAFETARKCGFQNINTDLIAGLPGDSIDGFNSSLNGILSLSPESITVHTLAMKRASNLVKDRRDDYDNGVCTVRMVDFSISELKANGYRPYYLYRQSKTLGGTENTGWAKPGYEGLYNVYIMDETHSILACGAGAVTKLRQPGGDYIERIFNYKFPYEYNSRYDDMILRKGRMTSFYETFYQQTQT
ncbi:MAG: coproporphyrinogen dehydrogenase HemZ [Oscillospiraceae bacterium]|nr:coproporphyrinogen dehydrogenase HemZ [Oscillospiraceae bacterium]MDD4413982.1 coproporphyrinogen dehydrogenase HemZ [Oscillospiraceae bacterium]